MLKFGFGQDVGIDLGTATVIVYIKGKGIVLREPSVVAVDRNSGDVLAVGGEARRMIGRTPGNIIATRPLRDGVISDYTVTEKMLKHFIGKVCGKSIFAPRIMICIPSQVTEVEKKALYQERREGMCILRCRSLTNMWLPIIRIWNWQTIVTIKTKYRQKRKEKDGIKSKRSGSKKNVWLQLCAGCGMHLLRTGRPG